MIPVSTKWQEAIREQFRYQGYLRIIIQVTPPGLQENLQVDTPDTDTVATTEVLESDAGVEVTPFVTLERNRWLLNGKFKLLPKDQIVDDWWSTPLKDQAKVLTFTFDRTYSIPGIYVGWDASTGTFPSNLLIEGYGAEGTKLYTYEVTDISSATGFVDASMDNVHKVVLTIKQWNVDGWRARIHEILFGLYASYDSINNGRIVEGESYDYAHPLCESLPQHTFTVSLRNLDGEFDPSLKQGISKYLSRRQLVQYQWGFATAYGEVEWSPMLNYYVDEFSIPEDSKEVSLSSTSRLALMTTELKNLDYDASDRTLYDVATLILQRSGVITESEQETPWKLSEKLKEYTTNAPIPVKAANVLLQLLTCATPLWLFTDPQTGYVCIDELPETPVQVVGKTQELGDPGVTVQETLHTVSFVVYNYFKASEKSEIASGQYEVTGEQTINITYSCDYAVGVTCEVQGATLVKFTPYSSSAVVQLKATGTAQVTVSLTGYEVKSSSTTIETYRNNSITFGLDVQIDTPFLTNTKKLTELSDWVVGWYNKPQKLSIPYIGYPELTAGDGIDLTTLYDQHNVQVLGNKIEFNGGFEGTLEVR